MDRKRQGIAEAGSKGSMKRYDVYVTMHFANDVTFGSTPAGKAAGSDAETQPPGKKVESALSGNEAQKLGIEIVQDLPVEKTQTRKSSSTTRPETERA